jgi:hypothetical protein
VHLVAEVLLAQRAQRHLRVLGCVFDQQDLDLFEVAHGREK